VIDPMVDAWCARDHAIGILPADHAAIEASRGPRAIIVERMAVRSSDVDLFNACAVLGRVLADLGASPTLAACSIDGAQAAVHPLDPETAAGARAAVAEGFAAARSEAIVLSAAARWEYPGCAVPLEEATVAIAAGYPEEDEDTLAAWAARVASKVARR
jgi:hypothetical protein